MDGAGVDVRARVMLAGLLAVMFGWVQSPDPARDGESRYANERPHQAEADQALVSTRRARRRLAAAGDPAEVSGSPGAGYHASGAHFFTWQEERVEAESWADTLAPIDVSPAQRSSGPPRGSA